MSRSRPFLQHLTDRPVIRLVLLLSLLLASGMTQANRDREFTSPERRDEQRARISAAQAANIVEQRYGGKVMGVQTRQGRNGVVYSVKILQSSGHMRTVNVDGQTGAILN